MKRQHTRPSQSNPNDVLLNFLRTLGDLGYDDADICAYLISLIITMVYARTQTWPIRWATEMSQSYHGTWLNLYSRDEDLEYFGGYEARPLM